MSIHSVGKDFLLIVALVAAAIASGASAAEESNRQPVAEERVRSDTVMMPVHFLDQLVQAALHDAHLIFDELVLTDKAKRDVFLNLQQAAQIAQREQVAPLAKGNEKIEIAVGESLSILRLDEKAIALCVAAFVRKLPASLSRKNRTALEAWADKQLSRVFATEFTLTLESVEPVPRAANVGNETPDEVRKYFFTLQRSFEDKPRSPAPAPGDLGGGWPYKFNWVARAKKPASPAEVANTRSELVAKKEKPTPAEEKPEALKKPEMVTVPVWVIDLLRENNLNDSELYGALNLDPETADKIYPAQAKAEHLARLKKRALMALPKQRIPIKVGQTMAIPKLPPKAIEECVALFGKQLPASISRDNRKVLAHLERNRLLADFGEEYSITLHRFHTVTNLDGSKTGFDFRSSGPEPPVPTQWLGYYFSIQRFEEGTLKPGSELVRPHRLIDGSEWDFLYIDDPDNPATQTLESRSAPPARERR